VVRVLTGLAALVGLLGAGALARAAWRDDPRRRIRRVRARDGWRLPATVREPLARALADAQIDLAPEDALGLAAAAVAGAGLLTSAFSSSLVPLAVVGTAVAGPVALVVARGRGQRRFVAALPGFVDLVAARLRSGHTVPTALTDAADRPDPVAVDLRRALRRVDHGEPLPDALAWWAADRRLDAVRAVAGAFAVAAATGGAAADALEGLARSLRDQLGARAEAAALSAQARMSAVVVGAAPVAYLAFASAVDPGAARVLVATPLGRMCLVFGVGLDVLGALWMRRIVRSEP
jgi:tight adherence protein B